MADLVKRLVRLVLLRDFLGFLPVVDAVSSSRSISVEVRSPWSGVSGRPGLMSAVEARRMTPPMREAHFFEGVWLAMAGKTEGKWLVWKRKWAAMLTFYLTPCQAVALRQGDQPRLEVLSMMRIMLGQHVFLSV